ncbi:hypothetical protein ACK3TF_000411 [Chlorella vulgaris]
MDPLETLGLDLLQRVFKFLTPQTLAVASLVSSGWRAAADADTLWVANCTSAWQHKVYIPAAGRLDLTFKQRYVEAELDAARTELQAKELCAFRWGFRFKEAAGAFWTAQDPFWSEGDRSSRSLMQRLFLANGSVCAPPDDPIFGDHERQWRFTKSKGGKPGHFIQINHWPSLIIERLLDGGWRMQNEWVVYEAVLKPGGPYSRGIGHVQGTWLA